MVTKLNNRNKPHKYIGVIHDYLTRQQLEKFYPQVEFIEFATVAQGVAAVNYDEVDAFIADAVSINREVNQNLRKNEIKIEKLLAINLEGFSFGFARGNQILADIFNRILEGISQTDKPNR